MCPIKVVRNGQKRVHWTARWQQTAMSVRSVLNTHAATRECWVSEWWHGSQHPGRMGRLWGCWKGKPSTTALWGPWMTAECCHMAAFLPYWAYDQEEWSRRCLICVQILMGQRRTQFPWGQSLWKLRSRTVHEPNTLGMLRYAQLVSSNS